MGENEIGDQRNRVGILSNIEDADETADCEFIVIQSM